MSGDALAIARHVKLLPSTTDANSTTLYVASLTCHAHCLIDDCDYKAATNHLQQAIDVWDGSPNLDASVKDPLQPRGPAILFALGYFGLVHAHLGTGGAPTYIDEAIVASRTFMDAHPRPYQVLPCWLSSIPGLLEGGIEDVLSWLLLVRAVMRWNILPKQAQESAQESMVLMTEYLEQVGSDMMAYARASVLGHKYILMCLNYLGYQGRPILNECLVLFRMLLVTEPDTARLALLVFVDIALLLSRRLPAWHWS